MNRKNFVLRGAPTLVASLLLAQCGSSSSPSTVQLNGTLANGFFTSGVVVTAYAPGNGTALTGIIRNGSAVAALTSSSAVASAQVSTGSFTLSIPTQYQGYALVVVASDGSQQLQALLPSSSRAPNFVMNYLTTLAAKTFAQNTSVLAAADPAALSNWANRINGQVTNAFAGLAGDPYQPTNNSSGSLAVYNVVLTALAALGPTAIDNLAVSLGGSGTIPLSQGNALTSQLNAASSVAGIGAPTLNRTPATIGPVVPSCVYGSKTPSQATVNMTLSSAGASSISYRILGASGSTIVAPTTVSAPSGSANISFSLPEALSAQQFLFLSNGGAGGDTPVVITVNPYL